MMNYLPDAEPMTEQEQDDMEQLAFLEEYRKEQEKKAEAKRLRDEEKANQKQRHKERRKLWWKKVTGRL